MTKRLESLLQIIEGHRLFIQTHDYPDPDALSSAFGLQQLLKQFGADAHICYRGTISKASTSSMVSTFGIECSDVRDIPDMTADDYIINVDSQMNNANIAETPGTVVACIDHHPTVAPFDYRFRDVRICGACASVICDYFLSNDIEIDPNVAACMLYGLKMDTENFNRGVTDLDIYIFHKLFGICDQEKLKRISNQQMEFADLKAYTSALSTIKIYDGIAFAFINGEASDGLVASVCDFMLTLVEVQFAIVYGYRGNGLKFSVRSELEYLDAGTIISNALEGLGSGGGHATMAGGYLPFENIQDAEFDLAEEIQNRFINAVYFSRAIKEALSDPLIDIK